MTPTDSSSAVEDLIDRVEGLDLHHGTENSLIVKLENALSALEDGDVESACNLLGAFIHQVEAQAGKKIPASDAASLIEEATSIRAMLGCG